MSTYIFRPDKIGRKFIEKLGDAVRRGSCCVVDLIWMIMLLIILLFYFYCYLLLLLFIVVIIIMIVIIIILFIVVVVVVVVVVVKGGRDDADAVERKWSFRRGERVRRRKCERTISRSFCRMESDGA